MTPRIIPYTSEAEWHSIRANTIGASEVAGLFNGVDEAVEGAFTTRFELWAVKSGKLESDFQDSERMFWGRKLEGVIAEGVAEQKGYALEIPEGYYMHPTIERMGCTPDRFIRSPHRQGLGCLEIKLVDYASFKKWEDGEPPLIYILQLQAQMGCTGCAWGAIGVLVNGNTLHVYEYERHAATIRRIEQAVVQFWVDVDEGNEPKAVADDYERVREYHSLQSDDAPVDLAGDNRLPELCAQALDARNRRLAAEKEEKAAKAEIIQKLGGAGFAYTQGFSINRKEIIKQMKAVEAHERREQRITIKETVQ